VSAILAGLLIWFWAGTAGDSVLRATQLELPAPLDRLVLGMALGAGMLGLLGFVLGAAGAYHTGLIWLLLILTLVVNWGHPLFLLRTVRVYLRRIFIITKSDRRFALVLILVMIGVVLRLGAAAAPPTGVDSLVYHLPLSQTYIAHRRFVFVPDIFPYGEFPQQVEMLYTLAMLLGPDSAAQVVHWGFGVILLAVIYRLGRQYLNEWQSLMAAGVFYAIGDVSAESSLAMIDLGVALFQVLAVTTCLKYLDERRLPWLVLSGMFIGFAAASKYTGVLIGVALAILLMWEVARRRLALHEGIRTFAVLGSLAAGLLLPWLIKNWILVGNPVSPFLSSIFVNPYSAASASYVEVVRSTVSLPAVGLIAVPLWLTYQPGVLVGSPIGPIFLAALPTLPWTLRILDLRRLIIVAAVMLSFWYFTGVPYPRFALAILALLTVPALAGLYRVPWERHAEKLVSGLVLAWCIFGMIGLTIYHNGYALSHVMQLGAESRTAYLIRALPARFSRFDWYPDILWLNDNLPSNSLVLVEDNRLPDLTVPARRWLDLIDSWGSAPSCYRDLHACLCDSGFTCVVMRQEWFGYRSSVTGKNMERLVRQGELALLHTGQQMVVYQVQCSHRKEGK